MKEILTEKEQEDAKYPFNDLCLDVRTVSEEYEERTGRC
jgi:hypothetical protein